MQHLIVINIRVIRRSRHKIAESLNIAYNTCCLWNRDYKEQIAATKAIYLEEMQDGFL
jgi:hypothetical protein